MARFFHHRDNKIEIFSDKWQHILLFWIGREDIACEEQEALITALIEFEDECGQENFYGFRAYLTAAMALSEFQNCSLKETIIEQLFIWALADEDDSNLHRLAARKTLPMNKTIKKLFEH